MCYFESRRDQNTVQTAENNRNCLSFVYRKHDLSISSTLLGTTSVLWDPKKGSVAIGSEERP